MTTIEKSPAWVFVSHASADLVHVRRIRNFLEEHNAAPILFHLKSLTRPEQFWPLIRREIEARNFFLLCQSESSSNSPWVKRELALVERIAQRKPIRVGAVRVDQEPDFDRLKSFVSNLSYYAVHPWNSGSTTVEASTISQVMAEFGYGSLGSIGLSLAGLDQVFSDVEDVLELRSTTRHAAAAGWLLVLVDRHLASSQHLFNLIPMPVLGASGTSTRVMFVLTEAIDAHSRINQVDDRFVVSPQRRLKDAIAVAAKRMLTL